MSHTLAARCEYCGHIDDPACPECRTPSRALHGYANQKPFRIIGADGYIHEWHTDCPAWTDTMERRL